MDWEKAIAKIAELIIQEQSPTRLLLIRTQFYDLISKCIQPSIILKRLTFYLMERVSDDLKSKFIEKAAYHVSRERGTKLVDSNDFACLQEHRLRMGKKDIFHLEAFVANIMSIYKR